jgi:hypothetical protein
MSETTRVYGVRTPSGERTFPHIGQRDDFLDHLGVAYADVVVGDLHGLAGLAYPNGVEVEWFVRVQPTQETVPGR